MPLKLERYKTIISGTEPNVLEALIRGLLIHYFFHVSNKQIVEVLTETPGARIAVNLLTPTVFKGQGRIRITSTTVFGVVRSPGVYGCSYIEARNPDSKIEIGEHTYINNGAVICSEGAGIFIGARCLIGTELLVIDSNGHEVQLGRRHLPDSSPRRVVVDDDVFIGSRVTLLKGTRIGKGSVISSGAVLLGLIVPPMSIVAGNPARVVGRVPDTNGPLTDSE